MEINDPIEIMKDMFKNWRAKRKYEREVRRQRAKKFWWVQVLKVLFWLCFLGTGMFWFVSDMLKTAQALSQESTQDQVAHAEEELRQAMPPNTEAVTVYLLSDKYKYPGSASEIKGNIVFKTDQPFGFEGEVVVSPEQYVGSMAVKSGEHPLVVRLKDSVFLILPEDKIE